MIPFLKIFERLDKAKVKYLVAGGVAVNLHQIIRSTMDLDLIVHLEKENTLKFVKVMKDLGYVPKVPVKPEDFASKSKRESWILEKQMVVFSFINPDNPMELIDIFVREPLPFEAMYKRKKIIRIHDTKITVIGIEDLLTLKMRAGRDKDLYDIKLLRKKL